MTTLREQIEAAAIGHYPNDWTLLQAVLDIIDAHRCIPDRDALARALHEGLRHGIHGPSGFAYDEGLADAIIAALEKP